MKQKTCCECNKKLTKDEKGLSLKLLNTDEEGFYCITCLAAYLGCSEEDLKIKISEFKEQGCTLFL